MKPPANTHGADASPAPTCLNRGEARHQAESSGEVERVSLAVKGLPLSNSYWTACGVLGKRDQEFASVGQPIRPWNSLSPLCNFGEFLAHFQPDLRELLQGIISIVRAAVDSNALWVLIVRHVENHPDVE